MQTIGFSFVCKVWSHYPNLVGLHHNYSQKTIQMLFKKDKMSFKAQRRFDMISFLVLLARPTRPNALVRPPFKVYTPLAFFVGNKRIDFSRRCFAFTLLPVRRYFSAISKHLSASPRLTSILKDKCRNSQSHKKPYLPTMHLLLQMVLAFISIESLNKQT